MPHGFITKWLLPRIFPFMPAKLPLEIAPTREFWTAVFQAKIEATIGESGDMIGWESDNNTVGPKALKAKQSLLEFIPHILPTRHDDATLYRFVLEHDDFGIHNMAIAVDAQGPRVTSLYDWETGCIVPAILADPLMAILVDLTIDDCGAPSITRVDKEYGAEKRDEFLGYAKQYIQVCLHPRPGIEKAESHPYHLCF